MSLSSPATSSCCVSVAICDCANWSEAVEGSVFLLGPDIDSAIIVLASLNFSGVKVAKLVKITKNARSNVMVSA